jgi:monovalent cation:H+ antiporter, CPA1 family
MDKFLAVQTLIILLLLVVSVVAIAVRHLRVPYTVALVIVGLFISYQRTFELSLTPELILSLFVPPLIFEAAFHLEFKSLRENWLPIVVLAVPGVLLTTIIVGLIVAIGAGTSVLSGLVFGALIAATDPVAVVAMFRSMGMPKRLTVLVESESLFNDGTAIVLFQIMLAAAIAGSAAAVPANSGFSVPGAIGSFLFVSAGGLGIGAGLGWLVSQISDRIDDYLIETTLTTVLAFGSYLVAEQFHVSGVLAVVAAGVVMRNLGLKKMSPTTKIVLFNFWEYLAFITNSFVFLLIGSEVNVRQIFSYLLPISVALAAVLISRALVVYGLTFLSNLRGTKVPFSYQHILFWGGLRGALSLALALSLPAAFADRELLRVMTFGIVLFTILVQGTTMQFLIRRTGIGRKPEVELEYERRYGRLLAAQSALRRVEEMHREGLISATTWEQVDEPLKEQVADLLDAQRQLIQAYPELQSEEHEDARLEGLRAKRATLTTLLSQNVISDTVYEELLVEVDNALAKEIIRE